MVVWSYNFSKTIWYFCRCWYIFTPRVISGKILSAGLTGLTKNSSGYTVIADSSSSMGADGLSNHVLASSYLWIFDGKRIFDGKGRSRYHSRCIYETHMYEYLIYIVIPMYIYIFIFHLCYRYIDTSHPWSVHFLHQFIIPFLGWMCRRWMPEGTFCIASSRERIAIMPLGWEENRFLILERLCVRGCGWWALGDDEDGWWWWWWWWWWWRLWWVMSCDVKAYCWSSRSWCISAST